MRKLFNDEVGFVVSAELVLVLTIAVLGMVVGLTSVTHSITSELIDVSNAFGTIDQSFNYGGARKVSGSTKGWHATTSGAGFNDGEDDCDCKNISFTEVCGKDQSSSANDEQGN